MPFIGMGMVIPHYFVYQRSININDPASTRKLARQIDPLGALESIFDEPLNHRFRRHLPFHFQSEAARLYRFGLRYRLTKRLNRRRDNKCARIRTSCRMRNTRYQHQPLGPNLIGGVRQVLLALPCAEGLNRLARKSMQIVAGLVGIVNMRTDI